MTSRKWSSNYFSKREHDFPYEESPNYIQSMAGMVVGKIFFLGNQSGRRKGEREESWGRGGCCDRRKPYIVFLFLMSMAKFQHSFTNAEIIFENLQPNLVRRPIAQEKTV